MPHNEKDMFYKLPPNSMDSASLLAWYTDVHTTLNSVISGSPLTLHYNLILPNSLGLRKPSFPNQVSCIHNLEYALTSWEQNLNGMAPTSIAYLLDESYPPKELRANRMRRVDTNVLAVLQPTAERLGFDVCFANMELNAWCSVTWNRYQRHGYTDSSSDDFGVGNEPEDFEMQDPEWSLSITHTCDLHGNPILFKNLDFYVDDDKEEVEDIINGSVFKDEPDEMTVERSDTESGSLNHIYRHSVLLLWPRSRPLKSNIEEVRALALKRLENSPVKRKTNHLVCQPPSVLGFHGTPAHEAFAASKGSAVQSTSLDDFDPGLEQNPKRQKLD